MIIQLCLLIWYKNFRFFISKITDFKIAAKIMSILVVCDSSGWYLSIFKQNAESCGLTFNLKKNLIVSSLDVHRSYLPEMNSLTSQSFLIHVITFWQHTYIMSNDFQEWGTMTVKLRTKIWWAPSELMELWLLPLSLRQLRYFLKYNVNYMISCCPLHLS